MLLLGFQLSPSLSLSRTTKIVIILIFLCLSRFGLWSFDLFELQLLQSYISENQRGFFNGIQESVINIAYITSFLLTIIVSDPSYFMIPAILSFFAVLLAALFVTSWATEELGRENPFPKLATFNLFKKQEEEAEAEAEQQEHQQERGQDANVPTSADLVDPSGIAVVEEDLSGQNPFEASQQPLPQQQQQQQYKRLVYHHTLHQQQQQGEESVVDYEPNELQQQDEEDARESGGRNNALNQSVAEQGSYKSGLHGRRGVASASHSPVFADTHFSYCFCLNSRVYSFVSGLEYADD